MLEHNAVLFLLVWLNVAYHVHKLPVEQARHHAFHTLITLSTTLIDVIEPDNV